jgi:1-acyl-sn-glycerol-3-phosphate acyltransferase
LYSIGKVTVGPALVRIWRPTVVGREFLPAGGGVILASNHLSVADELVLGAVVPRHLAFWAKSDYFTGTGLRARFTKAVLQGLGAIPVERTGGRAAMSAFDAAIPVLTGGGQVVIYPEGTRSPDGRLYRGRTGVARLALAARVPVVPVGVTGTEKVQPIGRPMPRLRRSEIVVRFGKPLDFTGLAGQAGDPAVLRRITDEVMAEIQNLSGQQTAPEYAPAKDEPLDE